MSAPASRPDPAAVDQTWQVVVNMPVFEEGRKAGQPVGWLGLNTLPRSVSEKIAKDKAAKLWRRAAYAAIVKARVPQRLGRISVGVELRFTETREERNAANFEPTIKPVIDALGPQRVYPSKDKNGKEYLVAELGREVVNGDDARYLLRPGEPVIGEPLGRKSRVRGQIVLTIRHTPAES